MPYDARVIVVGAGPVGLTMAAELARNGVRARVLDRSPAPPAGSRAIAIHARTLEVFANMGIVDRVLMAGHRIHGANVFAGGRRILHFNLDELASPYPFAIDLPQSDTERILTEHLRGFGIEVERSTMVTGIDQHGSEVTLFTQSGDGTPEVLNAEYVIGCDGAQSTVRQALGLQLDGEAPEDTFLLADLPLDWDSADDEWYLWFHEDGLLALFPLPGDITARWPMSMEPRRPRSGRCGIFSNGAARGRPVPVNRYGSRPFDCPDGGCPHSSAGGCSLPGMPPTSRIPPAGRA